MGHWAKAVPPAAVKVLTVLAFTSLSLGIFAWQGKVDWFLGLALAAGTLIGGQIGVRLTVLKGHRWVRLVVSVTVEPGAVVADIDLDEADPQVTPRNHIWQDRRPGAYRLG